MKWSDFPVLASWLDKAKGFVGTRGYAAPVGCELESLTAATTGAAVIFKPTTTVGRVHVKGSIMHDRQPRVVSDYIAEVMGKNPHVPIFQFTLSPKDQEDLDLSITCRLPTDSNGTVKLHVGDDQSGDVLFARRRPTSKKLGKDNYLLPQPTTHTLRFLSLKDAHRQIPIYSLPTSKQLQWKPDDRFGLTTPTMMSTTDAEPFLPFPMCHPLPLIGSNEKVVPGPATCTATNENPNAISDFGLCRYRGIFVDSPVHSAAKDECLTIPGQKWGSIFNDNAPAPGRAQDSPGRSGLGDVVHGACRVTNAFKKRLSDDIARWLVGVVGQRAMAREFHEIWAELLHEARSIPAAERKVILPRKAKEGTFDISTARLFWDRPRLQQRLISALQTHFPTIVCNGVCMYVLVAVFLRDFCALQKLWRKKEPLTDVEVASAKTLCQSIGTCWQALGWKPTPWVHWTVAHSHYFLAKYRTLYLFSSVPAEHRHRRFKVQVKNSMRGWSLQKPRVSKRGLRHVLNMETMQIGLRHYVARKGHAFLKRQRR